MIRERLVRIHVDDLALNFKSTDEIQNFQMALGKVLSFQLATGKNDGLEFVDLSINATQEIVGAFYPAVLWSLGTEHAEDKLNYLRLTKALEAYSRGDPVVVGAITRDDSYQYYS
ncbi:MAG: hypothetical protein LBV29_03155 [Azoarcus sp.]|jgi:hypothetical protein|nr:hypothetical protein [Azoarcus sp.]